MSHDRLIVDVNSSDRRSVFVGSFESDAGAGIFVFASDNFVVRAVLASRVPNGRPPVGHIAGVSIA